MIRGGMSNDSEKRLFLEHLRGIRAEAGKIQKCRIREMRRIIIIGFCVSMLPGMAHGKIVDNMLYKDYYNSITKTI